MGAFLQAHETIAAPIIEWGGFLFLVALILSPFAIIAHRRFRPTRWWHVAGAYVCSLGVYAALWYIIDVFDQWLLRNFFDTFKLSQAYDDAGVRAFLLWAPLYYSLTVFHVARLLFGPFTKWRLIATAILAVVLFVSLATLVIYVSVVGAAYALFVHLN